MLLLRVVVMVLLLLTLVGCRSQPPKKPSTAGCVSADDCPPNQVCVQGSCMTDAAERAREIPRARRAAEDFERAQEAIEDNRDRAIKALDEQR